MFQFFFFCIPFAVVLGGGFTLGVLLVSEGSRVVILELTPIIHLVPRFSNLKVGG